MPLENGIRPVGFFAKSKWTSKHPVFRPGIAGLLLPVLKRDGKL
jgi:hypothetical protein